MQFSWKRWKLGLVVAIMAGAFQALVAWAASKSIDLKGVTLIFAANVGTSGLLFLNQHPVEDIAFDTSSITKPAVPPTPPPTSPTPTQPTTP